MLKPVHELTYVIVLCDNLPRMKAFYRQLFDFPVDSESEESLALRAGTVLLALRQRSRHYDGRSAQHGSPGLQLAFRVAPEEVEPCYQRLLELGIEVVDPPTDQPRGHRTVYFYDPESNLLEVYAEI